MIIHGNTRARRKMYTISEGPYEETPRWHPMYWLGWTLRREIDGRPWDGTWWGYARPRTVARRELENIYGKKDR